MRLTYICAFMFWFSAAFAQDSQSVSMNPFDSSLFATDHTLTRSDYLLRLGKVNQTLNRAPAVSQDVPMINSINRNLNEDDAALEIIKERLSSSERTLNLRNLQMFKLLLSQINLNTKGYAKDLNRYDSLLDATKREIFNLKSDTVVRSIFQDRHISESFKPQLNELDGKWRTADKTIKGVTGLVDNTLARTSGNLIAIEELQRQTEFLLKTITTRVFSKEIPYVSEPRRGAVSVKGEYKKAFESEIRISEYYFRHTRNQLYLLLVSGCIFFYWVYYNLRSLRRSGKPAASIPAKLTYLNPVPIFASLLFILNLAPLFELNAPAIYIECVAFVVMIILTVHFWRTLTPNMFAWWSIFVLLSVILIFLRLFGLPIYVQRWMILLINLSQTVLGCLLFWRNQKHYQQYRTLFLTLGLYIVFNIMAFVSNLLGRMSLTNIFGTTAIFVSIQALALFIFVRFMTEAFLLQIQGSRIRKHYPEHYDYTEIERGISRPVAVVAVIIWVIVITTNLNIYITIMEQLNAVLSASRTLGSFSYTLRGVLLFLTIIWAANFLQKYIAYFFGDIGDDAAFDNKGERSRLLITRLILLIAGFLLAVAASGLPIDRITVILGALGVGIGLGLQSIVNNFVSGIIIIFDRPIRIGDTVEIGDKKGRVKEISVRSSTLLTPDGAEVIIPNGDILSHNIVNWTLSNTYSRVLISYTISRLSDSIETRKAITSIINSSTEVFSDREPEIFINSISSNLTQLKVGFWCKHISRIDIVRSEVYEAIYKFLESKDIKIM